MEAPKKIVIVYADHEEDSKVAFKTCKILERQGLKCWIAPRDLSTGATYPGQLREAIKKSSAVVLILSKNSNKSIHILAEIEVAFSSMIRIFSLKIQDLASDRPGPGPSRGTDNVCEEPRPDLIPTAIQVSPAVPVPGDVVTFDSGVENAGDADSSNFNVRWLVDGQDVGAYGGHQGVAAGTTVLNGNSQFVWTATAGEHTIEFLVDVDNHILETEEGNNSTSISVGASDLVCARGTGRLSGCVQGPVTGTVLVYEEVGGWVGFGGHHHGRCHGTLLCRARPSSSLCLAQRRRGPQSGCLRFRRCAELRYLGHRSQQLLRRRGLFGREL